ncbi:MAG: ester cyclase [Candidatus Riflebacteria bacterium]|nr:ester cyclase [Candidatus Riflebacteria bacterium]
MKKLVGVFLVACIISFVGCLNGSSSDSGAAVGTEKEIVRGFYNKSLTVNQGDTEVSVRNAMDELFTSDFQSISSNGVTPATDISNKQGMIDGVIGLRASVPDLKWEIIDLRQSGNRVIARSRATGTTKGEFLGLSLPIAKPFDIMTIDIHTVENEKIKTVYHVEEWSIAIQQLTN